MTNIFDNEIKFQLLSDILQILREIVNIKN